MFDANDIKASIGRDHLDGLSTALWVFDVDRTRIVWANGRALELWRADSLAELISRDMSVDMSVSVARRLRQYQEDFIQHQSRFFEVWTIYPKDVAITVNVVYRGIRLPDGRMAMLCEAESISDDPPDTLRSAEALLHTAVMISLYSRDGTNLYCNPAARAARVDASANIENHFLDHRDYRRLMRQVERTGESRLNARVKTPSGVRWHEITARECRDAITGSPALLLSENDISDLKETEKQVRYLADHDILTGLPNRNFLQSQTARLVSSADSKTGNFTFFMIDIDRFKSINDTFGHAAGDELLIAVAERLRGLIRRRDFVVRLGGDEFLVCKIGLSGEREIRAYSDMILAVFRSEFNIAGHRFVITPSIGVSRFPDDGRDLTTLLRFADVALYEAKSIGRNTYCVFSSSLRERIEEKVRLESDLHSALEEDQLELYFQPRVNTDDGEIVGAEALLRWNHPLRGIVLPGIFIPLCEETGLIHDVGRWVMDRAASEQRRLQAAGFPLTISFNLSVRQFTRAGFLSDLLSLSARTGCDPRRMELEITESVLTGDEGMTAEVLDAAAHEGYQISIDDFGTGYSNLAYIQKYPITSLKIDRSFIQGMDERTAIIQLIVSLCKSINVKPIAEGVETEDQLNWLKALGCTEYQGYYCSRPLPVSKFWNFLRQRRAQSKVRQLRPDTAIGNGPGRHLP